MEVRPDCGGRERVAALILGAAATAGVGVWASAVAPSGLLAAHATVAAGSVLVGLPAGAFVWARPAPRKWAHAAGVLCAFAGVNVAVGFAAKAKADAGRAHLYSLHSWAGLGCLVLLKGVLADAAAAHLLQRWRMGGFDTRRHVNGALAAFATGAAAALLGAAQLQSAVNAAAQGSGVYSARGFAANFIAIAVACAAGAFITAVRKRRWVGEARAKDADGRKESGVDYAVQDSQSSSGDYLSTHHVVDSAMA